MWLNCSNVLGAIFVAYIALTVQQLYKLANPLAGIEVKGPGVTPMWKEGQAYDIICFLSKKSSIRQLKMSKLLSKYQVIFQQSGLIHQSHQQPISLTMTLKTEQATTVANGTIIDESIFQQIQSNQSNVFLHVIVKTQEYAFTDIQPAASATSPGWWLHGSVRMIKYDVIPRNFRYRYLLSDFGLASIDPVQEARLKMDKHTLISYWKPEVSVHMVTDFATYPYDAVPEAVRKNVVRRTSASLKSGAHEHVYRPSMFVDETGLTSDKYIYLNESVESLPLTISIGPMSSQRWLLMSVLEDALLAQKSLGFSDKDLDDIRRMITETSLTFLLLTVIASTLHLLFEYLAFRSDVNFWKENKSLAGLSTRVLLTDLMSQVIVFLYLVESDASLLVIVPSFIAISIQVWKAKKATGLEVAFGGPWLLKISFSRWQQQLEQQNLALQSNTTSAPISNIKDTSNSSIDVSSGNENRDKDIRGDSRASISTEHDTIAAVVETTSPSTVVTNDDDSNNQKLVRVTLEADRVATYYLGGILGPFVFAYILYSLIYERHLSWYSWMIGSLTSCVYMFGFIFMCPQLYINHQLKSVSHLPWQYLIYKFLNTFVDDLFAFIIKMPMMHRLSVFRDDIVFLIYLYQRWIYRVDTNRPYEK